jgi:hypothetical protein
MMPYICNVFIYVPPFSKCCLVFADQTGAARTLTNCPTCVLPVIPLAAGPATFPQYKKTGTSTIGPLKKQAHRQSQSPDAMLHKAYERQYNPKCPEKQIKECADNKS